MASIISQAHSNDQDDLPLIRPNSLLSEVFCRQQLTSYEEYTIFPGLVDVTIGAIGRGRSNQNSWDRVQIKQKLSSQHEIIETIGNFDATNHSVASKLKTLYSNQRKHVEDIVHSKYTKEREISFTWALAQLHCNEARNLETSTKEIISITVYVKRTPLSSVDVIGLYREHQERAASKQGQMVTGQDTDQGKQDLGDIHKEKLLIDSMYDVAHGSPQSVHGAPRMMITLPSSCWTIQDKNEFPIFIERYGTDWHEIAKSIGTKTRTMIKNYYQRQIDSGNNDLEEKARIADEKRNRKESTAPLSPLPHLLLPLPRLLSPRPPHLLSPRPIHVFSAKLPLQMSMQSQQQHNGRQHKGVAKRWVCIEPLGGVNDEFRPVNPLAWCITCKQNKEYSAYYNAAAHLRRKHFMPKPRDRNKVGNADVKSEKREVKGGRNWPPMKELKRWMKDIDVDVSSDVVQQDDDEESREEQQPQPAINNRPQGARFKARDIRKIKTNRQIIEEASFNRKSDRGKDRDAALGAVTSNAINPNETLPAPPRSQDDEKDSRSLTSSKVDYSIPKEGLPLYTESPNGHLLLDDQTPPTIDSPSNSAMPSQDESLDSDMLSISDASEQFELLESNAAVNAFIDDAVNNLLSGFRSTTQRQFSQAASGNREQSTSTIRLAETGSSTTSGNSGQSRKKRRLADDDDDNADQDGSPKSPQKKICHSPDKVLHRSFACPYLKMDPVKHSKCCARQLTRIRDVKQHLIRRHTPNRYCQRCLDSNFCNEQALQEHVDLNTCLRNDPTSLEGISNEQRKRLQHKSDHKISEEEQWFAIWEILFLRRTRPRSAYMDTELSMELRLFREYCDTHGQSVVGEQYESSLVWPGSESMAEERRDFLQRAITRGMNRVFEDYRLSTRSLESLRSREQSGDSIPSAQSEAARSLFADSGIAEGSQSPPQDVSTQRHVPSQTPAIFGNGEPSASIPNDESSPRQILSQPPTRFGSGEPSSRRHIPSQSSPRHVSSRGHTPSQAPPIFDNGGPSVWMSQDENFRRHIPSQPSTTSNNEEPSAWMPQDESSQRQITSQAPPIFNNGGPSVWMSQNENFRRQIPSQPPPQYISSRRHIPSQPPARFDNGEPTASIPNDGRSRRQIPSQAPPTFNNRESGVWMAQHGSSQGQIPSQAPPVLDNGGPSVWMQQEGIVQMTQRLENDPLDLSNDFFDFDRSSDSRLDWEFSNQP